MIRGLRYPAESILEYVAAGDSFEDLLREFPDLEREDLLGCLEFAQRSLQRRSGSGKTFGTGRVIGGGIWCCTWAGTVCLRLKELGVRVGGIDDLSRSAAVKRWEVQGAKEVALGRMITRDPKALQM